MFACFSLYVECDNAKKYFVPMSRDRAELCVCSLCSLLYVPFSIYALTTTPSRQYVYTHTSRGCILPEGRPLFQGTRRPFATPRRSKRGRQEALAVREESEHLTAYILSIAPSLCGREGRKGHIRRNTVLYTPVRAQQYTTVRLENIKRTERDPLLEPSVNS